VHVVDGHSRVRVGLVTDRMPDVGVDVDDLTAAP
jgi:hypothetical protein